MRRWSSATSASAATEGKKYVYDDVGNLKEIRESTGKYNKLVEYAYDSQNQLTSEAYYKSGEAEAYITGKTVTEELAAEAAEIALSGALPLSRNGYKVQIAKTLVRNSLLNAR